MKSSKAMGGVLSLHKPKITGGGFDLPAKTLSAGNLVIDLHQLKNKAV